MEQMIQISIHYFAGLRDATKKDVEIITIRKGATAKSVYQHLITKYDLPDTNQYKVAVNDNFASYDTKLCKKIRILKVIFT